MSSRNRHAIELHEQTTTHARFSHWKLLWRNTHLMMWALCNSLTRDIYPVTHRIHVLTVCSYRNKEKTLHSKILSHIINSQLQSLMLLVGKSKSVCTSYLSQVKVNVKTVKNSHTQDIWRVLSLSAGQCHRVRETISFLACNLAKYWLVIKFLEAYWTWICRKF